MFTTVVAGKPCNQSVTDELIDIAAVLRDDLRLQAQHLVEQLNDNFGVAGLSKIAESYESTFKILDSGHVAGWPVRQENDGVDSSCSLAGTNWEKRFKSGKTGLYFLARIPATPKEQKIRRFPKMKKIKLLLAACILTSSILIPSPSAWAGDKPHPKPGPGPTAPDGNMPPWLDPQNPLPPPPPALTKAGGVT